jgi:1,4-dihydroxy-2-naphthoate octaprenyltransferase
MAMAHGVVDREDDALAGKRTFVVRTGDRAAAFWHLGALVAAGLFVVWAVGAAVLPRPFLCTLLLAPLGVFSASALFRVARERREVAALSRRFHAYFLHAGAGLLCLLACLASAPASARAVLGGAFLACYAPVAATLYTRRRLATRLQGSKVP